MKTRHKPLLLLALGATFLGSGCGGGGSGGGGPGAGGSGMGGAGSGGEGGSEPAGPLSLEISDVITSQYEDCIEPSQPEALPVEFVPSGTLHFDGTAGSDTLPEDWSLGAACSGTESGLDCVGSGALLSYTGRVGLVAVSFDVEADEDGSISFGGGTGVQLTAGGDPVRITLVANHVPGTSSIAWNGTPATNVTITNMDVAVTFGSEGAHPLGNNQGLVLDLGPATELPGQSVPYLTSFELDAEQNVGVSWLCKTKDPYEDECVDDLPGCALFGPDLARMNELNWEWDSSVDPLDPENRFDNPEAIQRATTGIALEPGVYTVACGDDVPIQLRSYDRSLARSCNFLTWYFSLREGPEPVTGLDVREITPTVDGSGLGVEAGATLTQNNTSRVALLLDRSFSITEAGATQAVIDSAKSFVDAMPDGTWFQVHQFASEDSVPLALLSTPSQDAEEVKGRLDNYSPWPVSNSQGFTKLFDAVGGTSVHGFNEPGSELFGSKPVGFDFLQKVMVVLSDGEDTASEVFEAASVQDQLRICRVKALSVGLGSGIQTSTLESLTGESVFLAADNDELEATFEEVAADLNSRYRFKMVTPQPVTISETSSLRIEFGGQQTSAVYKPPTEACELPGE